LEENMSKRVALITNVLDFVGPPAVEALLNDGYTVLAQDPAFQDARKLEDYANRHPGTAPLGLQDPQELGGGPQKLDSVLSSDSDHSWRI
jgi:hypothetical protein